MTVKTIVYLSTQTDWKIFRQGLVSAWSVHDSITASAVPKHYHAIIDCLSLQRSVEWRWKGLRYVICLRQALVDAGEENAFAVKSSLNDKGGDLSWGSQHFFTVVSTRP